MQRKKFLSFLGLSFLSATIPTDMNAQSPMPEKLLFKDDGKIPNSKFPLLVYRNAFDARGTDGAAWLEQKFAANNWTNSWRNGIYPFHHYHSTSHEVLGIYSGSVLVHLGGEQGQKVEVRAGDILVILAGVGRKNLDTDGLWVVGAYPDGKMIVVVEVLQRRNKTVVVGACIHVDADKIHSFFFGDTGIQEVIYPLTGRPVGGWAAQWQSNVFELRP